MAGWMRYLRGTDLGGKEIVIADARQDDLQRLALEGGEDPRPLLGERSVFGELSDDADFAERAGEALRILDRNGAREAIELYLLRTQSPVGRAA